MWRLLCRVGADPTGFSVLVALLLAAMLVCAFLAHS